MSSEIKSTDFSPGVLALLPLFYVGWSDSVLSPSEIKFIHKAIDDIKFLSEDDKNYLISHTDPRNPPSSKVFKDWLKAIKEQSTDLPLDQKTDLVKLGVALAQSNGQNPIYTKDILESISSALGVDNQGSQHLLVDQLISGDASINKDNEHVQGSLAELLNQPYGPLRERLKLLMVDPAFNSDYEPDKEIYRLKILKQLKALADQGVSSYSFPKKYGGGERSGEHIAVFETLAFGDLSLLVKFGVQFGLFGGALFSLGTEKHHRKYLEAMHRAELLGCFAMTETGHGSNVRDLKTTATYDHSKRELIIHSPSPESGKEYIGNALHAEMAAVFAQLIVGDTNHGVHAILVPLRHKSKLLRGVKVTDCGYKVGLNGVDNGRIWFNQVRVPVDNLLDKYGAINAQGHYTSPIENAAKRFFTMLGALVTGRICVGAASNNCSKKALTIAIKYAMRRRQFAPKANQLESLIMDYPTHQDRLMPRLAACYVYHFALRDLAEMHINHEQHDSRKIETLAAGLKSKASWHATDTIQTCREACGGKGYLLENQLGQLKADSDIFTTFEGDNTVLMQLVAKGLLTEFNQNFHDEGFRAVISFLLRKAKHKLKEVNIVEKSNIDSKHLSSIDFLSAAFDYRYNKILINLSERMRKYLGRKMDPSQAFLKTQVHMIDLADAYINKVCLQSIIDRMDKEKNKELESILLQITQLYGVSTMLDLKGWYLETDYISSNQSKALRRIKSKCLQILRPRLGLLVDSFDLSDELLKAPIAIKEFS